MFSSPVSQEERNAGEWTTPKVRANSCVCCDIYLSCVNKVVFTLKLV